MSTDDGKNILLLTTGGTIASLPSEDGFLPGLDTEEILNPLRLAYPMHSFAQRAVMSLDSSNIQPEHWRQIAQAVFEAVGMYDGVIVTHGTDTMAYTASALSFMLRNLKASVVLTGSQIPFGEPMSDAVSNLHTSVSAVEAGISGVTVAFGGRVINGTRAVKTSSMDMRAFESVNAPLMAEFKADGLRVYSRSTCLIESGEPTRLDGDICTDVLLLKLVPGTKPELLEALPGLGYRGVVIEAFGAGGVHYIGRDLISGIKALREAGVVVAVRSQCLYERVDLSMYEVGARLLNTGVIPCADMTTEAAVVKMMWALARVGPEEADSARTVGAIFATGYAGEITLR